MKSLLLLIGNLTIAVMWLAGMLAQMTGTELLGIASAVLTAIAAMMGTLWAQLWKSQNAMLLSKDSVIASQKEDLKTERDLRHEAEKRIHVLEQIIHEAGLSTKLYEAEHGSHQ